MSAPGRMCHVRPMALPRDRPWSRVGVPEGPKSGAWGAQGHMSVVKPYRSCASRRQTVRRLLILLSRAHQGWGRLGTETKRAHLTRYGQLTALRGADFLVHRQCARSSP
eukprot:3857805-Prymnesium_polylepis.1